MKKCVVRRGLGGWVGGWGRDNDVHVAVAHMVQVFG